MKNRQYQGVQLSKKESELIQFLQTVCTNIPFVLHESIWRNPGLKASKSEFIQKQKQIIIS